MAFSFCFSNCKLNLLVS